MKRFVLTLVFILVAASAFAQDERQGGILLSYHLQDPALGLEGFSLEGDWHPDNSDWISFAGHLSEERFSGAGPRLHVPVGPIRLYGHTLFGDISQGEDDGLNMRLGGGIEIPFIERGFVRFGPDIDGVQTHFTVGVGVTF